MNVRLSLAESHPVREFFPTLAPPQTCKWVNFKSATLGRFCIGGNKPRRLIGNAPIRL